MRRKLRGWWPGPIQAAGFLLGGLSLARWLLLGQPLDEALLGFAAVLIAWRPVGRRQEARNGRRGES